MIDFVDREDVGMVQAGSRPGFPCETHHAIGIASNRIRQNLQSDPAIEPGVPRQIDLSHAAGAEEGVDLVATESCAEVQYRRVCAVQPTQSNGNDIRCEVRP